MGLNQNCENPTSIISNMCMSLKRCHILPYMLIFEVVFFGDVDKTLGAKNRFLSLYLDKEMPYLLTEY